jgi:hypothetical protein
MRSRSFRALAVSGLAASVLAAGSTAATAAFPNVADCPTTAPNASVCIDVQSTSGFLRIKDFSVPIGTSFEIRGAVTTFDDGNRFIPPRGTTGVFSKPILVPGGLLGIDFPIPGNKVTAKAELAGSPSAVRFDLFTQGLQIPLKLSLSNPIIGPGCSIGSNSNPVRVNLITGTTNPPAPNRPISGRFGTFGQVGDVFVVTGNLNVDNSLSIPGASSCGIGLGLINSIVNLKLKLPSSSGNNEMQVANDLALKFLP